MKEDITNRQEYQMRDCRDRIMSDFHHRVFRCRDCKREWIKALAGPKPETIRGRMTRCTCGGLAYTIDCPKPAKENGRVGSTDTT